MADWAMLEGQRIDSVGVSLSNTRGTTVSQTAANTKSAYVQLVAATPFAASFVLIQINGTSGPDDYHIDLAVGAAAAEVVILSNLCATQGNASRAANYWFPIHIPSGVRLAIRYATSKATASNFRMIVTLIGRPFLPSSPLASVLTLGADAADSGGTQIDPGGTANTKGSYVELTASLTHPIRMLNVGFPNQANAARTACNWHIDIAVGGAGSEQVIVPNMYVAGDAGGDSIAPTVYGPIFCNIKPGQRIAARAACSTNDATDRLLDIILYGVR